MVVRVIPGEHVGDLVAALGSSLTTIADPFERALVVVPTRGIERYLAQELAQRNGVCANISFPSPTEFLHQLTRVADDPWRPENLVWRLLDMLDRHHKEPWCHPIHEHLYREDPGWDRSRRRFAVAQRIAGLLASYAEQRPGMLRAWMGPTPVVDEDLQWQVQLWRLLNDDIGTGPYGRLAQPQGLPRQIAVFGPTRMPERLLTALRDLPQTVDLYLPVASLALWQSAKWPLPGPRAVADSRDRAVHPLLRALGRDVREMRMRLPEAEGATAAPSQPRPECGSALRLLQAQISANTASTLDAAPMDDSLRVHACHGPLRQVEVLREAILGLLQAHPDLQPRDVIIMASDLDVYAPLLSSVFSEPHPRIEELRLRVADRTPEQDNEVLAALDALLALVAGRMPRSELVDLLQHEVVRDRFGISDDDVARIAKIAASAGVRWGLDEAHRAEFGMASVPVGTWSWGLDRMALGAALADDQAQFGGVLPLPDVSSGDIARVGALAEALEAIGTLREFTKTRHSLRRWIEALDAAIEDFTLTRFDRERQSAAARGTLAAFAYSAGAFADTVTMSLHEVRHMLAQVLAGRPTRSGFRLGGLTACRLEPMRSVPHRVVCLIGMDDGAFPRGSGRDGDDVLLRSPMTGERDPAAADRQMFLDAIMATGDHLVVTYTGRDERSNAVRQPAVPLAELIDLLPSSAVHNHPLQPFDARNFDAVAPFSHDLAALSGATALAGRRTDPRFVPDPLDLPDPLPDRSLDSLAKFLKSPPSTFLQARLGLASNWEDQELPEDLALSLSPLERYQLGDRLLRRGSAEVEPLRGLVPAGQLGRAAIDVALPEVEDVSARHSAAVFGLEPRTVQVEIDLGRGAFKATIGSMYGAMQVQSTFSRLKPKHVLGAWPYLLALACAESQPWEMRMCGRGSEIVLRAPEDPEHARRILLDLCALEESALRQPAPLPPGPGLAYAVARAAGEDAAGALTKAQAVWDKDYDAERAPYTMPFGWPRATFDSLLEQVPLVGEQHPDETSRFACLARRIWDPLLAFNPDGGLREVAA